METSMRTSITVAATIDAPVEKVWALWTHPMHIVNWNAASDDWHTPRATNDVRPGGTFVWHMAAKDGSAAFDFEGKYYEVAPHRQIGYTIADGRDVKIKFQPKGTQTVVTETFDAETMNSVDLQRAGWQAILDNFKKYVEARNHLETIRFEITIQAKPEHVYQLMLADKTYRAWTSEFNATSHYKGDWKTGSKILFLGTDPNGKQGGMVSRIKENLPNRYVSIEHYGILDGEREITHGPEVFDWAGSLENYTFRDINGNTLLQVELDVNQQYKSYFQETWPKALNKLKTLCES
jgi:uncharacterized protein YndB with AHSA1/START domain